MVYRAAVALLFSCQMLSIAYAQQPILRVSSVAWHGLTSDEKIFIQSRYMVEALGAESFGVIIDNQGVDRSTPGTTSGANLGAAIGSAAYVDKAFSGNNDYSAKSHLATMLISGFLGSALDTKPQSQYQFRYAVKLGNGSITYQDQISQDPFRHPVGVCVSVPSMSLLREQHLCSQSVESLRQAHIPPGSQLQVSAVPATPSNQPIGQPPVTQDEPEVLVSCKANNLAAVRTTAVKCNAIQGVIVQ